MSADHPAGNQSSTGAAASADLILNSSRPGRWASSTATLESPLSHDYTRPPSPCDIRGFPWSRQCSIPGGGHGLIRACSCDSEHHTCHIAAANGQLIGSGTWMGSRAESVSALDEPPPHHMHERHRYAPESTATSGSGSLTYVTTGKEVITLGDTCNLVRTTLPSSRYEDREAHFVDKCSTASCVAAIRHIATAPSPRYASSGP